MLRTFQPESKFNDLGDWNFADMARRAGRRRRARAHAAGVAAMRSPRAVATRGRFQLIEAMIARGVLSSTLERFVAGVKRLTVRKAERTGSCVARVARSETRVGAKRRGSDAYGDNHPGFILFNPGFYGGFCQPPLISCSSLPLCDSVPLAVPRLLEVGLLNWPRSVLGPTSIRAGTRPVTTYCIRAKR